MSHYASRIRWQEKGISSRKEARERAPGFGRSRWSPDVHHRENDKENDCHSHNRSGMDEPAKEMQNWYLHNALYLLGGVSFYDADVNVVREWASRISNHDLTEAGCMDIEWSLWGQDGNVDYNVNEGEELLLWEKLKILLTAAMFARDDEDDDTFSDSKNEKPSNDDSTTCCNDSNTRDQSCKRNCSTDASLEKTKSQHLPLSKKKGMGLVTLKKKMLILYAAYFELCPEGVFLPNSNYTEEEQTRYHRLRQVIKRSTRLCPSFDLGLTPLAIAATASAHVMSSSRFNPGPQRAAFDPTRDHLTLSRRVIDRLLALSPSAAKIPHKSRLPLHLAVASGKSWEDGIGSIYSANPEAVDVIDMEGQAPIHIAASCDRTLPVVIRFLVKLSPRAVQIRDGEGRLPLHLAAESGKAWNGGVSDIFKSFPEAAVMPDKKGLLPAYYRLQPTNNSSEETNSSPFKANTLVQTLLHNLVSKKDEKEDMLNNDNVTGLGGISSRIAKPFFVGAPILPRIKAEYNCQPQGPNGVNVWPAREKRRKKCDGRQDVEEGVSGRRELRVGDWESISRKISV